ncbi:hypothetical protein IFM89_011584 [Coptis chinensis]|uniref:Uncharacterized protein n=1 Tax=Coptis chinensis TaxID=261450 RepID=A0A835LLS9_9MAGN|nr:hypothetical protein IFM89_011584 [Coptis chinensis]
MVDVGSSSSLLNSFSGDQGSSKMDEGFQNFTKQRSESSKVPKTELEKYLEEDLFPFDANGKVTTFGILRWYGLVGNVGSFEERSSIHQE